MGTTKITWALIGAAFLLACGADGATGTPRTTDTTSGDGTVSGAGGGDESDSPTGTSGDATKPTTNVIEGLSVTGVAVFQGVKVDVVAKGEWVARRNAPVVAGRPALVRVYVAPEAGWSPRAVTAELRVASEGAQSPVLTSTKTISVVSKDETPGSTFDFEVPAEAITPTATFQVALTGAGAQAVTGESSARFPRDGSMKALEAKPTGKLRVVVVPVKYDADGSGRLPDTSAAQLDRYKRVFVSRYPTAEVEVTARAPMSWTTPIARNGSGFTTILRAITDLRQQDRAAPDVYYYGAFAPSASFSQYCGTGCVLGLSTVVEDASTSLLRASVGIGYGNDESASTAAHEIGHAHGREHAPCGGAQGVDASFPYAGGGIGVWGYDILSKTFMSPTKGKDMMGYCPNEWVSDYTYAALFDRITAVSKPVVASGGSGGTKTAASTWRLATVEADGAIADARDVTLDEEPTGGEARDVTYASESGAPVASAAARFYRFDHLPGGFLLLPTRVSATWSSAAIRGLRGTIAR